MLRNLAIYIIALCLLTACPDTAPVRENEMVNRWVYSIMEENYLWSHEMPEEGELEADSHPETYFGRLLYKIPGDLSSDRFSRIEYVGDAENYPRREEDTEYGFEAVTYNFGMEIGFGQSSSIYFCHVLMVAPNSPAKKAGVERGYCFQKINGQQITSKTQLEALLSGSTTIEIDFIYPVEKTVSIRKEYYSDSPVHFDSIYNLAPVTGYLVYTHFTDGNNNSYYNELRNVFAKFVQAGVENIILDLRYNGGGELTAARRMASLLAPPRYLGEIYLYKERNSSYGDPGRFESETLYTSSQMNGYNCGDISLYIITGSTTASASELVIHCLRPLYDGAGLKFVQVGAETYGKNVGGTVYASNRYEWEVSPITLRVYDINKVSGYEDGLRPDISSVERHNLLQLPSGEYVIPVGDWGDIQNELMLQDVMNDIYGYGGWTALLPTDGTRAAARARTATALTQAPEKEASTVKVYPLIESRVVIP
ncbi:MAG: hypothetical protein LIO77_01620 [Rikenellaceae bacterium]|nr:hypothetical protein [Rikenellaceae bacterium]